MVFKKKYQCICIIVEVLFSLPDTSLLSFKHWSIPPSPAMSHYLIISDLKHKYSSHCYFYDLTDQLLKSRSSLKKHLGLLLRPFVMTFDRRSHPTPDCAFLFTMHCPLLPGQGMMRKYKKVMCFVLEEVVFMKTVISYSFSLSHSVSLFLSFFFFFYCFLISSH